jgi:NitT/TauT family transport system substrate-binding protein
LKSLRRNVLRLCAAAILLGTAGAQVQAQAPKHDHVTLMLNWYAYSEHAPFFLGKVRNYYADEGIDIDIQEGRGSAVTAQAVAAGSVDFGYIDIPTMIKAASKGAPLMSVGVLLQTSPMAVMAFADKNLKTPQDIIGKTVATTPGDSPSQIWPLYLKINHISPDQFKTVSGDAKTKLNAVISGQADLIIGYVMDQNIKMIDATHKQTTLLRFSDAGINLINSGIIVNKDLLKNNPDLVKRFMRATTKAVEETEKDPAAAVEAILKEKPESGQRDTLLQGVKLTTALYHTKETEHQRPFHVTMKNVSDSLDLLVQYGGLDAAARGKPEDYVNLSYLPN